MEVFVGPCHCIIFLYQLSNLNKNEKNNYSQNLYIDNKIIIKWLFGMICPSLNKCEKMVFLVCVCVHLSVTMMHSTSLEYSSTISTTLA